MQIILKSLVQYKKAPAKVVSVDDKIEIELMSGVTKRVRDKDVLFIHSGPLTSFDFIKNLPSIEEPAIEEALELLEGEATTLTDLAELVFSAQTPGNLWSLWKLIEADTYFSGSADEIIPNDIEEAKQKIAIEHEKIAKKQQEKDFYQRLKDRKPEADDLKRITDVEELALHVRETSAIFNKIGEKQNSHTAHRYLSDIGYWDEYFNPYPKRQKISLESPEMEVPKPPAIERVDLTHLDCFAIDDEGNTDPDDAIGLEGDKVWVHVADVASLVPHNSPLDKQAQVQPSNLYIPETTVHMLPREVTDILGLGLKTPSPALSISFNLDEDLQPINMAVQQSLIHVKRISYQEADEQKDSLERLYTLARVLKEKRMEQGAIQLQFPEVKVSIGADNKVFIKDLPPYESRSVVMEFMVLAGAACAKFAQENEIPFVYSTQAPPNTKEYNAAPETFSQMMALRRTLSRSKPSETPEPHSGLGFEMYSQVTSPLRRYTDLSNHQQLVNYTQGKELLSTDEIKEKIMLNNSCSGSIRKAERDSNYHWKCVYLLQNKDWQGEATIVQIEERKVQIIVPALALETKIKLQNDDELDKVIKIKISSVDLITLDVRFKRL